MYEQYKMAMLSFEEKRLVVTRLYHCLYNVRTFEHYELYDLNKDYKFSVIFRYTNCGFDLDYDYTYADEDVIVAILKYYEILPKWLLLYHFFITTDSIQCLDVFQHIVRHYPLTLL